VDYIRERFLSITDTRKEGYVKHKLTDVLICIMCGVLCGFDSLEDLSVYINSKKEFLSEKFGIEKIPSRATIARILAMVDAKELGEAIIDICRKRLEFSGEVIAVDGKAIRSTSKSDNPHSALQILTAYLTESAVCLGQEAIHEKTNEIPVFQKMLDYLDVSGKTVTADAMHCQKKTCEKIIEKGGNYIFGLKNNQKTLYEAVELYFGDKINSPDWEFFSTLEKHNGRIEKRECWSSKNVGWLPFKKDWKSVNSIIKVHRKVETKNGISNETCYYISSLDVSSEILLTRIREHWKIEILHWLLDVNFGEDSSKFIAENAHKNLNILRKFAITVHKNYLKKIKKWLSSQA
jgi:predicted transposase YbfD/YdcC